MSFFSNLLSSAASAIPGAIGDLIGGAVGARSAESAGNKNRDLQREMAQHGVRWRVEDAKAAGIHPLAALGASLQSGAPAYVSGGDYGISAMGQDISRAIQAGSTKSEREVNDLNTRIGEAQLKNWELRNAQLEQELNRSQLPPPFPAGQSTVKPAEVTSWNPDAPWMTAGPTSPSGTAYDLGPTLGGIWNLPSGALNEALEDMGLAKYAWVLANNQDQLQDLDRRVSNWMEPYTGAQAKWEDIQRAARDLRDWADARRRALNNARNREFNRTKGWGREAR